MSVCSVSSFVHVTAPVPVKTLPLRAAELWEKEPLSRAFCPGPAFLLFTQPVILTLLDLYLGFFIPDFGSSLVYVLISVSPSAEPEPVVYLGGAGDLGR